MSVCACAGRALLLLSFLGSLFAGCASAQRFELNRHPPASARHGPNEPVGVQPEPGRAGRPDRDRDHDGIFDQDDACTDQPEDFDNFQDHDGCPEVDNDRDGVTDAVDRCPAQTGDIAAAGCPLAHYDAAASLIRLEAPLEFVPGSDEFTAQSARVLQAVQLLIATQTDIQRVRVESRIVALGSPSRNLDLCKRRARQVARWIRGAGIASERLEAVGCAIKQVSDRKTGAPTARETVELLVLDPAQSSPLARECQNAPL